MGETKRDCLHFNLTPIQSFFCNEVKDSFVCYTFKFNFQLDIEKVNSTINKIIERHIFLRTKVQDNTLVPITVKFESSYRSLEKFESKEFESKWDYLLCKGKNLQKKLMFDVVIDRFNNWDELSLIISLCINDGISQKIIGKEFLLIYSGNEALLPQINVSISEINEVLNKQKSNKLFHNIKQIENLNYQYKIFQPITNQVVCRNQIIQILSAENLKRLTEICFKKKLTVSSVLMYLFGETINKWLKIDNCLLFFVVSNRHIYNKKIQQNIGNFLDYKSILFSSQLLKDFQSEIFKEISNDGYSALDIFNSEFISKKEGAKIPILFSSILNFESKITNEEQNNNDDLPYSFKKNILFECQIHNPNKTLQIIFDYDKSIFSDSIFNQLQTQFIQNIIKFISEFK